MIWLVLVTGKEKRSWLKLINSFKPSDNLGLLIFYLFLILSLQTYFQRVGCEDETLLKEWLDCKALFKKMWDQYKTHNIWGLYTWCSSWMISVRNTQQSNVGIRSHKPAVLHKMFWTERHFPSLILPGMLLIGDVTIHRFILSDSLKNINIPHYFWHHQIKQLKTLKANTGFHLNIQLFIIF